jgi:hypothetical protein
MVLGFAWNSIENSGNLSTNGMKRIKIQKRIMHAIPVFKIVLQRVK